MLLLCVFAALSARCGEIADIYAAPALLHNTIIIISLYARNITQRRIVTHRGVALSYTAAARYHGGDAFLPVALSSRHRDQ